MGFHHHHRHRHGPWANFASVIKYMDNNNKSNIGLQNASKNANLFFCGLIIVKIQARACSLKTPAMAT